MLNLKRYCCRRMVLTHVDLIEKLLQYNRKPWCLSRLEKKPFSLVVTYTRAPGTAHERNQGAQAGAAGTSFQPSQE
jgi:hypothetical protein